MPTLGSMVQNGKLAAWALLFSQMALNSVDCVAQLPYQCFASSSMCSSTVKNSEKLTLPTLGRPTMPVLRLMLITDVLHDDHGVRISP